MSKGTSTWPISARSYDKCPHSTGILVGTGKEVLRNENHYRQTQHDSRLLQNARNPCTIVLPLDRNTLKNDNFCKNGPSQLKSRSRRSRFSTHALFVHCILQASRQKWECICCTAITHTPLPIKASKDVRSKPVWTFDHKLHDQAATFPLSCLKLCLTSLLEVVLLRPCCSLSSLSLSPRPIDTTEAIFGPHLPNHKEGV